MKPRHRAQVTSRGRERVRRKHRALKYNGVSWRYRLTVRTEPSQGLNTGSTPVSATNLIKINYLHYVYQGWNPNRIVRVSPLLATDGTGA
jgi:hypothetical protein